MKGKRPMAQRGDVDFMAADSLGRTLLQTRMKAVERLRGKLGNYRRP
jgi:hypothetical protein